MSLCAAVADVLSGSHNTLDAIFLAAGAPGPPPNMAHHTKWKTWLLTASRDPSVDILALIGDLIGEFMDSPPQTSSEPRKPFDATGDSLVSYQQKRKRLLAALEESGLRYFRGGRVLPSGENPLKPDESVSSKKASNEAKRPSSVQELLQTIIQGLPRAMHPLTHRRKGAASLTFESEYDIQDLLHSLLRPWIADIRPEEFAPSYAGSNTRMDFLLPKHSLVLEVKRVRDKTHANKIGDELIIDIEHYRTHPQCDHLCCIVCDPANLIRNPAGLIADLEGTRSREDGSINVRVFVISGG
jgi:hypothetical protein